MAWASLVNEHVSNMQRIVSSSLVFDSIKIKQNA